MFQVSPPVVLVAAVIGESFQCIASLPSSFAGRVSCIYMRQSTL